MKRCCHASLLHIENKSLSPLRIQIMGYLMVDWSGASVTPRGFSVTEETLERALMREAAHRTPPGKDAGGTEINPSPC